MRRILERGQELTELAKGSMEYTLRLMSDAFRGQFPYVSGQPEYWIVETFDDHVVVSSWGERDLKTDEYYHVTYTRDGETFTFAARDQWEIVELAYQPQTVERPSLMEHAANDLGDAIALAYASERGAENQHAAKIKGRGKGKRLDEALGAVLQLDESAQERNDTGPWKIKAIGITANVINANGRRYSAEVLREAVEEAQTHLTESFSLGRLVITGEPEHPRDKGTGRPTLLETVTNWTGISFDGTHVMLEGLLLGTSAGRDIHAQMIGGVMPDVSQRAKGDSHPVKNGEQLFEDVDWCRITGYDLVANGWGSDPDAGVTFSESHDLTEGEDMTKEELIKFLAEHPELFKGVTKEQVESMNADALKTFEEGVRKAMGIDAGADLMTELAEAAKAKKEMAESKQQKAVADAITEQTTGLKYGKAMNESFVSSIQAAKPKTADEVKALVESKRAEYDKLASSFKLAGMGFNGNGVQVLGPVLESETGTPEFARAAHELTESMIRVGDPQVRRHVYTDVAKLSINELYAMKYLERFDKVYGAQLKQESRQFEEAETTLDLNLPYSVTRAIVAEALPELVASGVFDMGVIDVSPFRLYFERFAGETGYAQTIEDEAIDLDNADSEGWVALANRRLVPGTAEVTSSPAGTTYAEGTDYTIDYANGRLMAIPGGGIGAGAALLIDYQCTAIRKGENVGIERGKVQLIYKVMDAKFDRLAAQITRETIVFSRSQIGWDAVTRTLVSLVNQIRRKIDQGLFYLALSAALRQVNNSGGHWASSGTDYEVAIRAIGAARSKVAYRYYTPTAIILSERIGDALANWAGFTQAGSRPDAMLNSNGYIGKVKGLPVFQTTEFSDAYGLVVNREVVAHRVLQPMRLDGPHDAYDATTLQLLPTQEWYVEEGNASDTPVPEKAAFVTFG